MDKELVPELRFEGFTGAWEQRKLGNCGTTYGGLTGKTKEDFGHGNARFIPYTNVFDNPLTDTKRLEAVEIDSSQNQVAYGDVFFTVSSETPDEVGMSSVWLSDQEDVYLNSFCFGYRQDSTFDPHYLAYMLRSSSVRSNLTLLAQGISRFNISKNKVMELSVPVPSAVEQKQLGQYFTKLDSLITLHQRKYETLRAVKDSMLDKMFPKEGETEPELRFEGFSGPWERRELEDIVEVCSGRDYKHLNEGPIPVYGTGGYMTSVSEALSYDKDAIGIGRKGTIDRPYMLKAPFWTVDTLFYSLPRPGNNLEFLLCEFLKIDWKSKDESTGLPSLSKQSINEAEILAPKKPEQQAIGSLFSELDSLITLHRRKCETLRAVKSSMLDKMFPKGA